MTENATGWWLVAVGAFHIAVHETSRLIEELHLPVWLVSPVVAVCGTGGVMFSVTRLRKTRAFRHLAGINPDDER